MTYWIQDVELIGEHIALVPLSVAHESEISDAITDGELWKLWFTQTPEPGKVDSYIESALIAKKNTGEMPFVIKNIKTDQLIGSTRFCNVDNQSKRLEIGYTWYRKSAQRTVANTEAKYLLLTHAFEQLNSIAVEFRTHWFNHKSREAILRLGAKQDGVLRNHKRMPDGSLRDTIVFSIIDSEWKSVKRHLEYKLNRPGKI